MKTFHILCLAGYGDILSHITRIPAVREKYPKEEYDIKFWLGGYGKSPQFSKEQIEREGYEASLIKNLTFHNQLPEMRKFIKENAVKEDDVFEDWSFCEEIFQNKAPVFMQYEMQFPYDYNAEHKGRRKEHLRTKKAVAIHPLTKSGNAEGFEHDMQQNRFWTRENWKHICQRLTDDGFTPLFVGMGEEDWGLADEFPNAINTLFTPIEDTIDILRSCVGCIATNSWDWEITSRIRIPTVCMYFKNHFFIQNHITDGPSDFFDTCYIETNPEAHPDDVYETWKYMYDNKKRPEVEYSACALSYNDEDCITNMLQNVLTYNKDDVIIVDGGSTDGTYDRIFGHPGIEIKDGESLTERGNEYLTIYRKNWTDDFEIQKNYALDQAKHKWRLWIDADETYEHLFWNQIQWYIWLAEKNSEECIWVPRINTIEGLDDNELGNYAQENGWQIGGFKWINYPDPQQRLFTDQCKFVGRTHERIVGYSKERHLRGVHCLHPKTKSRQQRGLDRERKQYEIEAQKIYERVTKDE